MTQTDHEDGVISVKLFLKGRLRFMCCYWCNQRSLLEETDEMASFQCGKHNMKVIKIKIKWNKDSRGRKLIMEHGSNVHLFLIMGCLTTGICPAFALDEIPKALETSSRGTWSPGESWMKCTRTFSPPLKRKIYFREISKGSNLLTLSNKIKRPLWICFGELMTHKSSYKTQNTVQFNTVNAYFISTCYWW